MRTLLKKREKALGASAVLMLGIVIVTAKISAANRRSKYVVHRVVFHATRFYKVQKRCTLYQEYIFAKSILYYYLLLSVRMLLQGFKSDITNTMFNLTCIRDSNCIWHSKLLEQIRQKRMALKDFCCNA